MCVCTYIYHIYGSLIDEHFTDNITAVHAQVHPNPKRPSDLKLKLYEFAGKVVGKCLFESSLGRPYRQLVKARFSKSFLAQLMGLRVNYKVRCLHISWLCFVSFFFCLFLDLCLLNVFLV